MDTTSSLIAIVDISLKLMKYMSDVHDGGKERSELHSEVLTVYVIFWKITSDFGSPSPNETTPWSEAIKPLFDPDGIIEQLKQVLEQITAKIIIQPHSTKGTIKKLKWPFEKSEVQRILERLRSYKDTISVTLNRANMQIGIKTWEDIQFLRNASEDIELTTALDWISPLDFVALANASQRQPLRGTGKWFLNNSQIRGWCDNRTKVVWCHGIPGAGKTVLATTLFQELQKTLAHNKVAVLIAYCSFDVPSTHSADNMLSSLLRQLVESRGLMSEAFRELYYQHTHNRNKQRPGREVLVNTISRELESFDKTYIIVDGLDEIPDNKEKVDLLAGIEFLQPTPQLLVTSRPVEALDTWFKRSAKADGGYRVDNDDDDYSQSTYYCDYCASRSSVGEGELTSTMEFEDWKTTSSYRCKKCSWDVCVNCYDRLDICYGCNSSKQHLEWAWPGAVPIAAQSEDLEKYILWRIERSDTLQVLLQNANSRSNGGSPLALTPKSIIARVQQESHKMFLLARFHMDALEKETTARRLMTKLENLPSKINDIYDSLFSPTAKNPLSTDALAHAITVQPGDDDIDELDLPDVRYLASMCAGLVAIEPSGFVRLAHETLGHYIAKTGMKSAKSGHSTLTEICLTYLQFTEFASGASYGPDRDTVIKNRQEKYPFLPYAALHWGIHMRHAKDPVLFGPSNDTLNELAKAFLAKSGNVSTCGQFMWLDDLETSSGWDAEYGVRGLHLATYLGLTSLVPSLLTSETNVDVTDCMERTPLMYATHTGHADIVRILLHSGADPGRRCRCGRTALHRACARGTVNIVEQLVESPKDILINEVDQSPYRCTALTWAIRNNSPDIVKALLTRKGINMELAWPGKENYDALHCAVLYDRLEIAKILLADVRVDIESRGLDKSTPLISAAKQGYEDMVSLLIKSGANLNARDVFDGPAILRAVDNNALGCVRSLVSHGADYQFKDVHGRCILHGATINRRSTILHFLLSELDNLDANVQDNRGDTPLHDAVSQNSESTVRVLLDHGARTDIENLVGKTPLRLARDECNTRLETILLAASSKEEQVLETATRSQKATEADADLPAPLQRARTPDADYTMPLETAVRCLDEHDLSLYIDELGPEAATAINDPSLELLYRSLKWNRGDNMRILLDRGIDINLANKWGSTPLHSAVWFNRYAAAELLIERGCNLDIRDAVNRTPLIFAARDLGKPAFAYLIVKHGATIGPSERDSLLPTLNFAVDRNDLVVVRRLVEEGVPFLFKDVRNQTPYQRAKRAGLGEIVQYLYDKARGGGGQGLLEPTRSISSAGLEDESVLDLAESPTTDNEDEASPAAQEKATDEVSPHESPSFEHSERVSSVASPTQEGEVGKTETKRPDHADLQDTFARTRREVGSEIARRSTMGDHAGITDREIILVVVIVLLTMLLVLR